MLVWIVSAFFLWMGVTALLVPARVLAIFGTEVRTRDTRNEIRAVYGGFGVAVAGLLAFGQMRPDLGGGILIAIAVAVLGMAAGRVWSAIVDRGAGLFPWLFFGVEVAIAAGLWSAVPAIH